MGKAAGRRSAADRVKPRDAPIRPARKLSPAERKVWRRIMDAWPPSHFVASDADALGAYCAACVAFEAVLPTGDLDLMGKAARMMAMLGTKLRIMPQSRTHRHAAGTAADAGRDQAPARKPLLGGMGNGTWRRPANGTPPN
jgi:hypothetical protein